MTREQAKDFLPIITAFAEGKTIEVMNTSGHWEEINIPNFDIDPKKYRIKPKPKYRPFNNARECWEEMQKHQPFGWIKPVNECANNSIAINIRSIGYNDEYRFKYLCKDYTFIDETPFGILEEE